MKVNIAKSAGFCFGVKRAIDIAFSTAQGGRTVEMLGAIVHNQQVVDKINAAGIKKIARLGAGRGKILLIRAHGAARDTYAKAVRFGYTVVDATCPMVKEIHEIAKRAEKNGRAIVIIGDKKHDEVLGIIGQLKNKVLVVDAKAKLPVSRLKKIKKATVVVQSTQNIDKVLPLVEAMKKYIHDLEFCNTICRPTRIKQKEIKTMPLDNDVVLVIGSKHSANTKRLYEISSLLNKNTFWVERVSEIRREWFNGARSVGISAGASTPEETTVAVAHYVENNF